MGRNAGVIHDVMFKKPTSTHLCHFIRYEETMVTWVAIALLLAVPNAIAFTPYPTATTNTNSNVEFVSVKATAFSPVAGWRRWQSTVVSSVSVAPSSSSVLQVAVNGDEVVAPVGGAAAPSLTEPEVRALFHLWNDALATGDSRIVARRYSSDPMLLPTVSDIPRTNYETIKDYFDMFLKLKPQGVILNGKIRIGKGWAQDAGLYEVTMGATGNNKVKARYSFVYIYENGQWKISHHHSSTMPEGKSDIEEPQVRNLFHLWNDALDTCTLSCCF